MSLFYQLKMLKYRPRLWWNSLWIRKDEFHSSLVMDSEAMLEMNREECDEYRAGLCRRRKIAHDREMEKEEKTMIDMINTFGEEND